MSKVEKIVVVAISILVMIALIIGVINIYNKASKDEVAAAKQAAIDSANYTATDLTNTLEKQITKMVKKNSDTLTIGLDDRPTFGQLFGVDDAGEDKRPQYKRGVSTYYYEDSTGALTLDTTTNPGIFWDDVPLTYLIKTNGEIYTIETERETTNNEDGKTITVRYDYIVETPTTTTALPNSKVPLNETTNYQSEDQKAIAQGLKDGSLVKLANGNVVSKEEAARLNPPANKATQKVAKKRFGFQ